MVEPVVVETTEKNGVQEEGKENVGQHLVEKGVTPVHVTLVFINIFGDIHAQNVSTE